MHEEEKTYKYLGILEVDTSKHVEMKEKKNLNNTSGERENYTIPNYSAKISSNK